LIALRLAVEHAAAISAAGGPYAQFYRFYDFEDFVDDDYNDNDRPNGDNNNDNDRPTRS
jgi:hypothetical protein